MLPPRLKRSSVFSPRNCNRDSRLLQGLHAILTSTQAIASVRDFIYQLTNDSMSKIAKIVTVGAASVPLTLLSAGLAFAQATTTGGTAAPNTGAGAAAGVNTLLLAASAAIFALAALYVSRARRLR